MGLKETQDFFFFNFVFFLMIFIYTKITEKSKILNNGENHIYLLNINQTQSHGKYFSAQNTGTILVKKVCLFVCLN